MPEDDATLLRVCGPYTVEGAADGCVHIRPTYPRLKHGGLPSIALGRQMAGVIARLLRATRARPRHA
jgi:hypothetical protein